MNRPGPSGGFFDLVTTLAFPYRGLVHACRDYNLAMDRPEIWDTSDWIRKAAFRGPFWGAACILSRYGNLEIVAAQSDGALAHFWLNGIHGWRGPAFLPGRVEGPPAFIQGRFGSFGNFEVIVPRLGGGLSHFWRENDRSVTWHEAPPPTREGRWSGVGFIHNNEGNLELAGVKEGVLVSMWQHGVGGVWFETVIEKGFVGRPSLIQNDSSDGGCVELIAAGKNGGLHCFYRATTNTYQWCKERTIAEHEPRVDFDDITILQSNQKRLEMAARRTNDGALSLVHYRRNGGGSWESPNKIVCY
ncbi:MAG TPA: hypothetical protein VGK36_16335 [Candidatus Angelobacter sp.]